MVYSDGSDDGPLMFERCNSIPEKGNRVAVVMRARGGRVATLYSGDKIDKKDLSTGR